MGPWLEPGLSQLVQGSFPTTCVLSSPMVVNNSLCTWGVYSQHIDSLKVTGNMLHVLLSILSVLVAGMNVTRLQDTIRSREPCGAERIFLIHIIFSRKPLCAGPRRAKGGCMVVHFPSPELMFAHLAPSHVPFSPMPLFPVSSSITLSPSHIWFRRVCLYSLPGWLRAVPWSFCKIKGLTPVSKSGIGEEHLGNH